MELLFFAVLIFSVIYFNSRIAKAESRIDILEKKLAGKNVSSPIPSIPPQYDAMSTAEEQALVKADTEALLRPAPAPAPLYRERTEGEASVPKESNEEEGARWLGRIGAVAVLLGVVFFLKYAFDSGLIGETGRVAIGILFGIIMVGVGQKLRSKYLNYSDILIACGVGILYLSIYASYGFYHLVLPAVALLLMALITGFALFLAVIDGSMGLALFATLGGFATPVLLSTGENHLVGLSLYMIILDLGVFGTAFYRKWLRLNVIAFIGTVSLFMGWMGTYYTEAQLPITLIFASIFFGLFLATSVLHHLLRKEATTLWDLALITATAGWYFLTGYQLLDPHHHEYLGFFALLLGAIYLACAYVAFNSNQSDRTLNLFLPGIAVVFLTVAIPLQLTGHAIAIAWLIEALVLLVTALYLRERVLQVFAWLVLFLGIGKATFDIEVIQHALTQPTPFWNVGFFLSSVVVVVLYLFAYSYHRMRESDEESLHAMLLALVLASLATATAFSIELNPSLPHWTSLPWLFEGLLVLFVGLRVQSSLTQWVGWFVLAAGILTMEGAVGDIHRDHAYIYGATTSSDAPAFFNLGTFLMFVSVMTTYAFAYMYFRYNSQAQEWKKYVSILVVIANLLTISSFTTEIGYSYDLQTRALYREARNAEQSNANYYGNMNPSAYNDVRRMNPTATVDYKKVSNIESSKESAITIFWAVYAILLLIIGFAKRSRGLRLLGLILFFVTAGRVFLIVWQLGALARIVSSIAFGLIALAASFLYAKYKSRLKEILID